MLFKRSTTLLVVLIATLLSQGATWAQEQVYVQAGEHGQGMLRARQIECFVITPYHVVEKALGSFEIIGPFSLRAQGTVIKSYEAADLAIVRLEAHFLHCREWLKLTNIGYMLNAQGEGMLHIRELDGSTSLLPVRFTNVGDDYATVTPTDASSPIEEGMSGAALVVNGTPLGMLLSVDTTGVGTIILRDAITRLTDSFFEIPRPFEKAPLVADVETTVNYINLGGNPQIRVNRPSGWNSAEIFVSFDGENYQQLNQFGEYVSLPNREDRMFIKLVSKTGQELGPFEKEGLFGKAEKEKIELELTRSRPVFIECWTNKCELERQSLCGLIASRLTLSRSPDTVEMTYDLKACAGPERAYQDLCLSAPNEIFPLMPDKDIFATLEYDDGHKIPFKVRVEGLNTSSPQNTWVTLQPMPGQDTDSVPYAAARLDGVYGPFIVYFGAGGCDPVSRQDAHTFLYDIDGKGLVQAQVRARSSFSTSKPLRSFISLAYDYQSRQRIGPFDYRFDVNALIQARAQTAQRPRLECTWEGDLWFCLAPGTYGWVLEWVNVRVVRYGPREDQINQSVSLALGQDKILQGIQGGRRTSRDFIMRFDIPEEWTDVYYQLQFANGEETPVLRIPLRKN